MLTTKILRDLNAECPEGMTCGLVILYDDDNSDEGETIAGEAFVGWYRTEAEMLAAWDVALHMDTHLINGSAIKRLDELATTQYVIAAQTDEDGTGMPYITWGPKDEFAERLAATD